jgi:hypothetical protein
VSDPKVEVEKEVKNTLTNLTALLEDIQTIQIKLVPAIKIYAGAEIKIGTLGYGLEVGWGLKISFSFALNKEKCLWPYVWRKGHFALFVFFETPELTVFGRELLPKFQKEKDLFKFLKIPWGCLFKAKETREGYDALVDTSQESAHFFHDFVAGYELLKSPAKSEESLKTRFQLFRGVEPMQSVLMNPIQLGLFRKYGDNLMTKSPFYIVDMMDVSKYSVTLTFQVGRKIKKATQKLVLARNSITVDLSDLTKVFEYGFG